MAGHTKRRRKPEDEHTFLAVRVEDYEASVDTSVNPYVYGPQYAWNLDEDDPLYQVKTCLTIYGTSTYPDERAGQAYELTVYGDDKPSRRVDGILRDVQARDEHGAPRYREYRGRLIPVYDPPSGLGLLEKVRGEPRWRAWIFIRPRFVNEALVLLGHGRSLFLALHECKIKRARWIRSVSLQTTDPAEE